MIKLTRLSDNKEFGIDDESQEWKATKIEGIDAPTTNIYTETPAIGTGEIVTGKYTGRRDITVTAHRSSQEDIRTARSKVLEFFEPDDTYTMEITYNGKTLYIDCELLNYSLPTENIYKPLDLTFTMLCPQPYFYDNNTVSATIGNDGRPERQFINDGQIDVSPIITITQESSELEFELTFITINIGTTNVIRIVLDDSFKSPPSTGRPSSKYILDTANGTLTEYGTNKDLTRFITSGNPQFKIKHGNDIHFVMMSSKQRETISGNLLISSSDYYHAVINEYVRELTIKFPDNTSRTFKYAIDDQHYNNYTIRFSTEKVEIWGPTSDYALYYTAILHDSGYQSTATIKFNKLYRGF